LKRRISRGIGGFVRRAAPVLRNVARLTAPSAGKTVRGASRLASPRGLPVSGRLARHQALAEALAGFASRATSAEEADTLVGAAIVVALSDEPRSIQRLTPHLVRDSATLTRRLRRRRVTRPAIRALPTIVRRTVHALKNDLSSSPAARLAHRRLAEEICRVLGHPEELSRVLHAHVQAIIRTAVRID
jgi:hypothetical protein